MGAGWNLFLASRRTCTLSNDSEITKGWRQRQWARRRKINLRPILYGNLIYSRCTIDN